MEGPKNPSGADRSGAGAGNRRGDAKTTQNPNPAPTDPPPIGCGREQGIPAGFWGTGTKTQLDTLLVTGWD